jgi:SAM-dependent methyltransferase
VTDHVKEIGEAYENSIQGYISAKAPDVAFYSSVTGGLISENELPGASYWRQNMESPVLFSSAVQTLLDDSSGDQVFVEIGPHSALQGPLRQIFQARSDSSSHYVPAMVRNARSSKTILHCAGQLFMRGFPIDFTAMAPGRVLTDLPAYPWNHEVEYWDESRVSRDWRQRRFGHHDILGSRITDGSGLEPTWRNVLRAEEVPWIRDHQIASDVIFPAAGYVAMAGEAARQLTGTPDFTVRRVTIDSAFVISESAATEVVTSLRPLRLTDTTDSAWYEFSISCYNGTSWTRHCTGQVCPGQPRYSKAAEPRGKLPRDVSSARWYRIMRQVKLCYGPRFQRLQNISTGTVETVARATMHNELWPNEAVYQVHPSTIDACIQLFSAAAARGQPRNLTQFSVPSSIESLYIGKPDGEMDMSAEAFATPRGRLTGNGVATSNGKVVLEMKGLKLSPIEDKEDMRGPDPHAACRLHWLPDIDFLSPSELVRPADAGSQRKFYLRVERLALLCTIESSYRLQSACPAKDHLVKYQSWLDRQADLAAAGDNSLIQGTQHIVAANSETRTKEIESLTNQILQTPTKAAAVAVRRVFDSCQDILGGKEDGLEILVKDGILAQLYNVGGRWGHEDFFKTLCHAKPWLRVLEIGAGTGGMTATVLDHLSSHGERMHSLYHYTDISSGFFAEASERFSGHVNMKYSALDISKDPIDQGFEAGSYDLVIAANVLHATPNLGETLRHVRKLLKPDGHLFLNELSSNAKWLNYIMGTLPGWWLGENDGRRWEPYVSPDRWAQELNDAGFAEPAVITDDIAPFQGNALIISSPLRASDRQGKAVTLLCDNSCQLPLVDRVESDLQQSGYTVERRTINEDPRPKQDIISVLDLKYPVLRGITEEGFQSLVKFLKKIDADSGVLWCTRASQIAPKDPTWAQFLGFARTVRNELAIDIATLELDHCREEASEAILDVLQKFQRRTKGADYDPEYEWVLDNNRVQIGRFHWFSINNELTRTSAGTKVPKRLEVGRPGFLNTLGWEQQPRRVPAGDEIEVEVRAAGMNFKVGVQGVIPALTNAPQDVLIAQGIVEGHPSEGKGLGCECAGIVLRAGPNVENVDVGDRVMVLSGGSYSTSLVTRASLCACVPAELSFAEAATMPCVYSTVIHSVVHLGRLRKGQASVC